MSQLSYSPVLVGVPRGTVLSAITECVALSSPADYDSQMKPGSLSSHGNLKDLQLHKGLFFMSPISLISTVNVLSFSIYNVGTHLRMRRNQKEGTSPRIDFLSAWLFA